MLLGAIECTFTLALGQAVEQGVDSGTRGIEARLERVALGLQGLHLLHQEAVGALQLFMAQEQPLYALGQLFEVLGFGHGEIGLPPL